ncbi:MAG: hypothetical protein DMG06_25780 [Acidobacteria bacterium]|nr:MAG: hypothetical protein DMG06_25780 [Acidobacteriota bacterium]
MRRALILFLTGGWLTGTVLMWVVATQNFRRVDAVLTESRPELKERISSMTEGDARLVLRLLASELNRFYFRAWGATQLVVGGILLALVLWAFPSDLKTGRLVGLMWGITGVLLFFVVPKLVHLGRQIDFVPRTPFLPQIAIFWRLHLAYTLADMVKFVLGIWVSIRLARNPELFSLNQKPK